MVRPTLAFVGAGRVGSTLSQTLHWRGYVVSAVYSRSPASAQHLAEKLNTRTVASPVEAALSAQLTFLTVPDDVIAQVCQTLARDQDLTGRAVVHTSGVSGVELLLAARASGAWIGGLHPMIPILDMELSHRMAFSVPWVSEAPDVTFGVEAESEPLHSWLADIVHALNGVALWLHPGQDRARYHAAGVIASNYVVTLFDEALHLLQSLGSGTDERLVRQTLVHLVENTLQNIKTAGTVQALTGPIARGDAGTVRKHLEALEQEDAELAALYRLLGRRTTRLAAERGLDAEKLERIRQSLEESHANDYSKHPEDEGHGAANPDAHRV
jgi:predicted short-subunit dehydrogenase-like oxidoreductase (DUF2520 family)